jgi:hypothetical protein
MFTCTSLKNAPELPATDLADACYNAMFWETPLDLSTTSDANHQYPWKFKVEKDSYYFKSSSPYPMFYNKNLFNSAIVDDEGYVTFYSAHPLSASLITVLTKEGTTLASDTEKANIKDGKLLEAIISVNAPNNVIMGSGGQEAYISLKNADTSVASSKKFAVNVSDGKIKAENIDLYKDNSGEAAPDDATENNITPGKYDAYMRFVAA